MHAIRIETVSNVAFDMRGEQSVGYWCDVPFDSLNLPCLNVFQILKEAGIDLKYVEIGFGHPDSYRGYRNSVVELSRSIPGQGRFIRSFFTNELFDEENQRRMRALKPGLVFLSTLHAPDEKISELRQAIADIHQIGVRGKGIAGEVKMDLISYREFSEAMPRLSEKCVYQSLTYSIMLGTPACFEEPYQMKTHTREFIPGYEVSRMIMRESGIQKAVENPAFKCTNAYISDGQKRFYPLPTCVSVVKLDKEQLRYRLAEGKDPNRVEQDVVPACAFTDDTKSLLVGYITPDTQRITVNGNQVKDALSTGQLFTGSIYGTDEEIRYIAEYLEKNPIHNIGDYSHEGYGEVYFSVIGVEDQRIPEHVPVHEFDFLLAADTILINDEGMPANSPEDVKNELERLLDAPGRLEIAGKYFTLTDHFRSGSGAHMDNGSIRCISKGSVIRMRVKGEPLDVFPILHCFIGEHTEYGYGEAMLYPARNVYYRLGEKRIPLFHSLPVRNSSRALAIGSSLTNYVIESMVKNWVKGLAYSDREEYRKGIDVASLLPKDILDMFRENYDPMISEETICRWYIEALEEEKHDSTMV